MGPKHTRQQMLDGAVEAAANDGLSQLTFGRLAKRLGVNDRILVYYFPTKDDLITAVLLTVGTRMQAVLERAFTHATRGHLELARAAWPVLARPESDPVFSLFFESVGLAVAGIEPYRIVTQQLVEGWADWLTGFFTGTARQRRTEAEAAIALLDGLLLLRQISGPAAANRAAARLGLRS